MKIGLLSDTHGWIHPSIYNHFAECDEIWHAGDFGNLKTADTLASFKTLRGVHGNIDDSTLRGIFPASLRFKCEEMNIWMTHIGGSPGNYSPDVKSEIYKNPPDIFICGHSHIAKVIFGAAGYIGFHKYMTIIRFSITGNKIHDLELIEMGERGKVVP